MLRHSAWTIYLGSKVHAKLKLHHTDATQKTDPSTKNIFFYSRTTRTRFMHKIYSRYPGVIATEFTALSRIPKASVIFRTVFRKRCLKIHYTTS